MAEPYPGMGFVLLPEYLTFDEANELQRTSLDNIGAAGRGPRTIQSNDGRFQLPPMPPSCFVGIQQRLEREGYVAPQYLNNQTVNYFQEGDFIRAHVDNMFVYDELFAVLSLGADATLQLTHIQTGEACEVVIPSRSVYLLFGPARYAFYHAIMPTQGGSRMSVVLRCASSRPPPEPTF